MHQVNLSYSVSNESDLLFSYQFANGRGLKFLGLEQKAQSEFGDLLFSLVNYARFVDINPEEALERTNKKFIKRFQYLESESARDGKKMSDMTLAEMDEYWERAKESK